MKPPSRRTLITLAIGAAAVIGVGAAAVAIAAGSAPAPTATPTVASTPTPTPTPTPTELPASAPVAGSLDGWTAANHLTVAQVLPQVGDAAEGVASAYIDAPVVGAEVAALETDVVVEPGVSYDISVKVRVASLDSIDVPAAVTVGTTRLSLPPLNAWWQTVEGEFTADADTAHLAVVLSGPVAGLGIDDIVIRARGEAAGANVVPNPSFEQISAAGAIVNRSLVLPAERAVLAVEGAEGRASWTVSDASGAQIATGARSLTAGVTPVPLAGIGQGYYTVTVTDAAGTTTSTPIAVIDMPEGAIALDPRFGVGLHVENDYYADAAQLAASLGIGLARNDILWARNETTRGVYDFQPYYADSFDALHAEGIHLLGIVNYGNKLYGDKNVPSNPEALAAYGRYAAAIAQRFDLVGLEVFNEFNHDRFNTAGCGTAPTCYIPLLQSVHDAVRAVNPDLPIVAGSTALYDAEWFDGLWQAGAMAYTDIVSYHPYELTNSGLADAIDQSKSSMQTFGGQVKPIWVSEFGTSSTLAGTTQEEQGLDVLKGAATTLGKGVDKFFWYDLINDSTDPNLGQGNFGLFGREIPGVSALPPKKSAFVTALLIAQLAGREARGPQELAQGVTAYAFGSAGDEVTAAWANEADVSASIATKVPLEIVRLDGTSTIVKPVGGVAKVMVPTGGVFIRPITGP